jgi:hypothetical protein
MLTRYIQFDQIDVYGRLIPSRLSFLLLINELPDEASENEFIEHNNAWVLASLLDYHPEKIISPKTELINIHRLKIDLLEIEKRRASLAGINFPEYIQNRAVFEWFQSLRGNHRIRNIQPVFRGQALKEIPHNHLRLYPEYVAAVKIIERADELSLFSLTNSLEAQKLKEKYKKAVKKMARAIDEIKAGFRKEHGAIKYPHTCEYCGKYVSISKGKTCGRKECENKAVNDRVRKTREGTRPKGWVKHKIGECKGGCGSIRRRVDLNDCCEKCYYKKM